MRFSFFMMPLHLPSENPSLALERDIALIERAEELGYDEFFIGEHHSAGWETIASPEMVLAKASATAKRIRLGTSMVSLPFHHPFHVAERFTLLDHLTRGRAVLGVGPSGLPPDVKLFGIPPDELSPRMMESLEIIVRLLESDEPITYEGRFWQLKDMLLQLPSYQVPRLKLALSSVGSKRSLQTAARYEMLLFSLSGGFPPNAVPLSDQWSVVQEAGNEYGTNPSREDWRIVTYIHLADTREKAWKEASTGIERDVHEYFYTVNGPGLWVKHPGQDPATVTARDVVERRRWLIGTPDDAIEWIEEMWDETGGFGGLMMATHEWMPQQKIDYSLELFARYVMPHFRGHTARLKGAWELTKKHSAEGSLPNVQSGAVKPSVPPRVKESENVSKS